MNKENNELKTNVESAFPLLDGIRLDENTQTTYLVKYRYTFQRVQRESYFQSESHFAEINKRESTDSFLIERSKVTENPQHQFLVEKRIEMLKNICIERCPEDDETLIKSFSIEYNSPTFNHTKFISEYEMSESI